MEKKEFTKILSALILIVCFITNLISITGFLIILGFYFLVYLYKIFENKTTLPRYSYHTLAITILISAVVLYQHLLPGFNNILIFDAIQVSKNGAPFTMYFNIDKTLTGLILLFFVIPQENSLKLAFKKAWYLVIIAIFLLIGLALLFNFIKIDFKLYNYFIIWGLNNLFIVAMAEEVLFRGFLQRHLSLLKIKYSDVISIVISAAAFGLLHWQGGMHYVLYATIAGMMYGLIYQKSNSILFNIISHFLVNLVHIIFFTYPFLR